MPIDSGEFGGDRRVEGEASLGTFHSDIIPGRTGGKIARPNLQHATAHSICANGRGGAFILLCSTESNKQLLLSLRYKDFLAGEGSAIKKLFDLRQVCFYPERSG